MPGNWIIIREDPCLWIDGSLVPSSSILLRTISRDCATALDTANFTNSLVKEILTSSSNKKEMHFNYECLSIRSSITAILSYEATGC